MKIYICSNYSTGTVKYQPIGGERFLEPGDVFFVINKKNYEHHPEHFEMKICVVNKGCIITKMYPEKGALVTKKI